MKLDLSTSQREINKYKIDKYKTHRKEIYLWNWKYAQLGQTDTNTNIYFSLCIYKGYMMHKFLSTVRSQTDRRHCSKSRIKKPKAVLRHYWWDNVNIKGWDRLQTPPKAKYRNEEKWCKNNLALKPWFFSLQCAGYKHSPFFQCLYKCSTQTRNMK